MKGWKGCFFDKKAILSLLHKSLMQPSIFGCSWEGAEKKWKSPSQSLHFLIYKISQTQLNL